MKKTTSFRPEIPDPNKSLRNRFEKLAGKSELKRPALMWKVVEAGLTALELDAAAPMEVRHEAAN